MTARGGMSIPKSSQRYWVDIWGYLGRSVDFMLLYRTPDFCFRVEKSWITSRRVVKAGVHLSTPRKTV